MSKARTLADFISDGSTFADGTISVAEVSGAAPLASPTFTGNVDLGDNVALRLGDSDDLQIYHDGSNSWIRDEGTGSLYIRGSTELALQSSAGDNYLQAISDGTTRLFYDHSEKFATTSTGVSVTGDATFADNGKATFGDGSDLQIYHDGSNSYIIDDGAGDLLVMGDNLQLRNRAFEYYLSAVSNGAVELYYDNSKKLATTSTGISVTGNATFADNGKAIFGAGSDLQIYHDGSDSYIDDTGTGALILRGNGNVTIGKYTGETMGFFEADGAVYLYHDNSAKLTTSSTGISVTGTAVATTDTDTTNTGTVTLDFGANQNFVLTLTGNVTLANPTTEQVGQSGFIVFIQDATGGRTVSLGTDYETAGGAGLTLSSAASTTDVVPYIVAASGRILLGAPQLAFA